MPENPQQLKKLINGCLIRDRHRFRAALQKSGGLEAGEERERLLKSLRRRIEASRQQVDMRRTAMPAITYPAELPVSQKADDIGRAIAAHQVVIIAGETGSGKTTQIPKICLAQGRGLYGMIGHTQPRRLAARSVSSRIAEELGVREGEGVGHQVRFQDQTSEGTWIKLMTDGILLSETRQDPFLNRYDTLIIDEAHERSLNIDFLLGYLKRLLPKRPDLKLVVTSATIDVEKFSAHFDDAPVIEVSGRTYPVDIVYRDDGDVLEDDLTDSIIKAIHDIRRRHKKKPVPYRDILVFLSGEKEIRDAAEAIRRDKSLDLDVLPLYARLSNKEQNRVFQSHPGQRVVLATNVAETSITVPGIGYVIDPGTARISRYSVRSKVQRLPVEAISQASANQRAGRCGRLCEGTCLRLYTESDFNGRPAFTDTEITRTNLASVILQMLVLNLGDIHAFPFIDKPESTAIKDGFKILEELGAVNARGKITRMGRDMARFPVDPRLARMLLAAAGHHCLTEMLVIVSALSVQDPRERPLEKQQAADEMHARYRHPESDFLAFTGLWDFFEEQRQALGRNQLAKFCRQHFLSYLRMREWRDIHRQLRLVSQELKLGFNHEPADYEAIHRALLSGLISQVASRLEDGTYLGARNRKFRIFPGSVLHGKKVAWVLSAELVETSQLFARMNARVESAWIEALAGAMLRRQYAEPHWEKKRGKVVAYEKVTLYGLTLVERRRVPYGAIDAVTSRDIFISEGLVKREINTRLPFYRHYCALVDKIEKLEDKTRKKDILVQEQDVCRLFDALLPTEVIDQASLERWARGLDKTEAGKLLLTEAQLLTGEEDVVDQAAFPDRLESGHLSLELDYRFNPGSSVDGVSVDVPVSVLMQVDDQSLERLVPGMLRDKCIALVKALPKKLRKHFVPVPDFIDRVLPAVQASSGDLKAVLARQLQGLTAVDIPPDSWDGACLDDHLLMNINVLDENGRKLGGGRDIEDLRRRFAAKVAQSMAAISEDTIGQTGLTAWTFGSLEPEIGITRGGINLRAYPGLRDAGDSVALCLFDTSAGARIASQRGVARLYMFKNRQQLKYLRKTLFNDPAQLLQLRGLGDRDSLLEEFMTACYIDAFDLENTLPRSAAEFEANHDRHRADLAGTADALQALLGRILGDYAAVKKALAACGQPGQLMLQRDVQSQLDALVYPGFLREISPRKLREYPRYLQAIVQRLEKFPRQEARDREWTLMLQDWREKHHARATDAARQPLVAQALEDFRWMLEELRVSLFAQSLGTPYPISEKRLEKRWREIG